MLNLEIGNAHSKILATGLKIRTDIIALKETFLEFVLTIELRVWKVKRAFIIFLKLCASIDRLITVNDRLNIPDFVWKFVGKTRNIIIWIPSINSQTIAETNQHKVWTVVIYKGVCPPYNQSYFVQYAFCN